MTKKYQICHHQIRFFKLKMHQNPFSAIPPPHSSPRSTPSASRTRRLRRLGSQAPSAQNPGYASAIEMAEFRHTDTERARNVKIHLIFIYFNIFCSNIRTLLNMYT